MRVALARDPCLATAILLRPQQQQGSNIANDKIFEKAAPKVHEYI
jgi:hypothetical protein